MKHRGDLEVGSVVRFRFTDEAHCKLSDAAWSRVSLPDNSMVLMARRPIASRKHRDTSRSMKYERCFAVSPEDRNKTVLLWQAKKRGGGNGPPRVSVLCWREIDMVEYFEWKATLVQGCLGRFDKATKTRSAKEKQIYSTFWT